MPKVLISFDESLTNDKTGNFALTVFRNIIEDEIERADDPSELDELNYWAYHDLPLSPKEAIQKALKAKTLKECHDILQRTTRAKGRPATLRTPAIKALVYKEFLGWTWPKLRDHFCPCGKPKHDSKCQESLRSEVGHLKRLMKKYRVELQ